jgi:mono/diheme cytochrome c family protein
MRLFIGALLLAAIALPVLFWSRTSLLHARMPADGGWSQDALRATVGEPLQLQITSDDVVHGFAVGRMDMQSVDILPGKVSEVSLLFEEPGTYTFYCTRWCGVDHWRMRGTIEVEGEPHLESAEMPLYVGLGMDLDAPRNAPDVPAARPSAGTFGQDLSSDLEAYAAKHFYRAHSPYQLWLQLQSAPAAAGLSDQARWDLTASIWLSHTDLQALANGKRLYSENCAACHGEAGGANGVFADDLAAAGVASLQGMGGESTMSMQTPADLSDPGRMLAASPALLQGKILRGGMGTGMPSWGPIFTDEQTWDLVAYIYSLQFEYP